MIKKYFIVEFAKILGVNLNFQTQILVIPLKILAIQT